MYTFPELLKKIREEGNLTQEELARAIGVSTILISMIEVRQKEVSKGFILKLAEKLEVRPDSIIPFIFIDRGAEAKKFSKLEKAFIKLGEKFQTYLIKVKAKNLRKYAY